MTEEKRKLGLVRGFQSFISQYGVIPLAIGVVIANAVNDFVKSLVDGLVTPLVSLISPNNKLQNLQFMFHGADFKPGEILSAFLSFLIIALLVYITAKVVLRNEDLLAKK